MGASRIHVGDNYFGGVNWVMRACKGHVEDMEVKCVRVDSPHADDFVTAYAIGFGLM